MIDAEWIWQTYGCEPLKLLTLAEEVESRRTVTRMKLQQTIKERRAEKVHSEHVPVFESMLQETYDFRKQMHDLIVGEGLRLLDVCNMRTLVAAEEAMRSVSYQNWLTNQLEVISRVDRDLKMALIDHFIEMLSTREQLSNEDADVLRTYLCVKFCI